MAVAIHTIAFPAVALWLNDIAAGRQRWYRRWVTSVYRSGGWLLLRKWTAAFRKDWMIYMLGVIWLISLILRLTGYA